MSLMGLKPGNGKVCLCSPLDVSERDGGPMWTSVDGAVPQSPAGVFTFPPFLPSLSPGHISWRADPSAALRPTLPASSSSRKKCGKAFPAAAAGILQKASVSALRRDFILEAQAVSFGRVSRLCLPEGTCLCVSCKSSSSLPQRWMPACFM